MVALSEVMQCRLHKNTALYDWVAASLHFTKTCSIQLLHSSRVASPESNDQWQPTISASSLCETKELFRCGQASWTYCGQVSPYPAFPTVLWAVASANALKPGCPSDEGPSVVIWHVRPHLTARMESILLPAAVPVRRDFPTTHCVHGATTVNALKFPLRFAWDTNAQTFH